MFHFTKLFLSKYPAFRLVEELKHLSYCILTLLLLWFVFISDNSFPGEAGREKDARETSLVKERIHERLSTAKSLCTYLYPPPSFAVSLSTMLTCTMHV